MSEGRGETRWGVVALGLSAGFVAAMQIGKVPPALPGLREELAIGLVAGGWVASLVAVTSASLGLAAGALCDRFGVRRAMAVALTLIAFGSLLGGLAGTLGVLLVARLIESVGFVAVVVAAPALIASATREADRRLAIGAWSTYFPVGFALMLLLAEPILGRYGWRGLWFCNAGITAAFAILFLAGTRGLPRAARAVGSGWRAVRETFRQGGLWLLAACFLLYSLQWNAIMVWLPTLLTEVEGDSGPHLALLTALAVGINTVGNLGGTWLLHRGVPRWRLIAASAAATALLGGAVFLELVPGDARLLLALAYSVISGVTPAAALTGAVQHAPSPAHVGASNGIVVQGAQAGSLLGPPVLAAVVAGGGWYQAPWLFAVASALSLVLALAVRRLERGR